jgi:NAD(P)-dependent dehydrogenase (short-subunit alcohol dehydrogenase family)
MAPVRPRGRALLVNCFDAVRRNPLPVGPNQGVYSITKAAVIGMTKVFAAECASMGVRVNAVLPGITEARFTTALVENEAILGQYLEHVPLKRVAQPIEIAGAVLYLASSSASYTAGVCLPVDGGYLVK